MKNNKKGNTPIPSHILLLGQTETRLTSSWVWLKNTKYCSYTIFCPIRKPFNSEVTSSSTAKNLRCHCKKLLKIVIQKGVKWLFAILNNSSFAPRERIYITLILRNLCLIPLCKLSVVPLFLSVVFIFTTEGNGEIKENHRADYSKMEMSIIIFSMTYDDAYFYKDLKMSCSRYEMKLVIKTANSSPIKFASKSQI